MVLRREIVSGYGLRKRHRRCFILILPTRILVNAHGESPWTKRRHKPESAGRGLIARISTMLQKSLARSGCQAGEQARNRRVHSERVGNAPAVNSVPTQSGRTSTTLRALEQIAICLNPSHRLLLSLAAGLLLPLHAQAMPVTDTAGDLLATYAGPKNGDVDVLSAYAAVLWSSRRANRNGTRGALGVRRGPRPRH